MKRNYSKLYGRIPLTVLMDKDLTATDIRVYAGMAYWVRQGDICNKPHAEIALVAGGGHISAAIANRAKTVCSYQLNSLVFGQKQRAGVQEIVSSPSGGRRLASVRTA